MREAKVLKFLESGPKTFTQIENMLHLWPATVNRLLDDLAEVEKIQPVRHERKAAYGITKKGTRDIQKFGMLGWGTNDILENGGKYYEGYSGLQNFMWYADLSWETQDDLVIDKNLKKINPITTKTAQKLQEVLYNSIKDDVENGIVKLDNTKQGTIILGFHISYNKLVKSIFEQSYEYYKIMSKREFELRDKIEDETLTKDGIEELATIRKKTRAKLGKRR